MAFAVQRIDHVEVFVRDIARAAEWYGEVLGLREVMRWDPEPVMLDAGNSKLALFRSEHGQQVCDEKSSHWHRVAWRTDEAGFAAAQQHLRSKGIAFRGPVDHGQSRSIYFADLDGNPLEITFYL